MARYEKFEDLPVWQEAAKLYNRVLDLLEEPGAPLTPGFRNQLDRATLSVSNNIASGFERVATNERLSFLALARAAGSEVRSMLAAVKDRPKLIRFTRQLEEIRALAESCAKQLTGWIRSAEKAPAANTGEAREHSTQQSKPGQPRYEPSGARGGRGESATP